VEAKRPAAREKLIALFTKQSSAGKPDEREPAGEALIALLIIIGDEKLEKKQYPEAAADYRRAFTIAQQKKSESLDEVKAKMEFALSRDRTMKQLARLQEKLLKDADSATAEEVVKVLVVDLDDPASAVPLLGRVKSEQLKKLVPLAAKAIGELSADEAMPLAELYKSFADANRGPAGLQLLNRAEQYFQRFLELEFSAGVMRTKAEVFLKEVQEAKAKLTTPAATARPKLTKAQALTIIEAKYGADGGWADVTDKVQNMVTNHRVAVTAINWLAGSDPRPFAAKSLVVRYRIDKVEHKAEVGEHRALAIIAPVRTDPSGKLQILEARYGAADKWVDVTKVVRDKSNRNSVTVRADLGVLGIDDPINGVTKALVVFYTHEGKTDVAVTHDGGSISLP